MSVAARCHCAVRARLFCGVVWQLSLVCTARIWSRAQNRTRERRQEKRVVYSYRCKKEDQPAFQTTHLFSTIKYNNECNEIISVPSHDTIPSPPLRLIPLTSATLLPNLSCSRTKPSPNWTIRPLHLGHLVFPKIWLFGYPFTHQILPNIQ